MSWFNHVFLCFQFRRSRSNAKSRLVEIPLNCVLWILFFPGQLIFRCDFLSFSYSYAYSRLSSPHFPALLVFHILSFSYSDSLLFRFNFHSIFASIRLANFRFRFVSIEFWGQASFLTCVLILGFPSELVWNLRTNRFFNIFSYSWVLFWFFHRTRIPVPKARWMRSRSN